MGGTLAQKLADGAAPHRGSASAGGLAPGNKNRQCLAKSAEPVYCFSEILAKLACASPGAAISGIGAAGDSLIAPQVFEIAQNWLVNNEPARARRRIDAANSDAAKK
jgi:hypothetical protein